MRILKFGQIVSNIELVDNSFTIPLYHPSVELLYAFGNFPLKIHCGIQTTNFPFTVMCNIFLIDLIYTFRPPQFLEIFICPPSPNCISKKLFICPGKNGYLPPEKCCIHRCRMKCGLCLSENLFLEEKYVLLSPIITSFSSGPLDSQRFVVLHKY